MRDVVGTLEWVGDVADQPGPSHWQVRRKDGTTVRIDMTQVVAAKIVPDRKTSPRGARSVADDELERIAAAGWRPLVSEPLGDWTLRASGGFTGRANSVLPLGDPGIALDGALAHVVDWYQARQLPPLFQIPLPYAAQLDAELDRRDWVSFNPTLVMVADLSQLLMAEPARADLPEVRLTTQPSSAWLQTCSYRGQKLPPVAPEVMVNSDQPLFASIADNGRDDAEHESLLAVARGAIHQGWLGITAVDVIEGARRRGLASHMMRALFEHARTKGVRYVYLQATAENLPAQALYEGMGFTVHHRYHYRRS